ncbi:hypothetical protein D3C76_684270 [compost metagenome]
MLHKHIRITNMCTHDPVEYSRCPLRCPVLIGIHMTVRGTKFSGQHFFAESIVCASEGLQILSKASSITKNIRVAVGMSIGQIRNLLQLHTLLWITFPAIRISTFLPSSLLITARILTVARPICPARSNSL